MKIILGQPLVMMLRAISNADCWLMPLGRKDVLDTLRSSPAFSWKCAGDQLRPEARRLLGLSHN